MSDQPISSAPQQPQAHLPSTAQGAPTPLDGVQQAPGAPKKRISKSVLAASLIGLAVGVAITLGVQGLASIFAGTQVDPRLAAAYAACDKPFGASLEDGGQTIVVDVKGNKDTTGASYASLACLLSQLKVPSRVTAHIDQTTSMDGRQTESWDGITIEWSYHPDRGADTVITTAPAKR